MKLVHRVSLFFLTALAVVLLVYSTIFYVVVRNRLVQQFDQHLNAALHALVAAVEVEPEEVKWQPLEHDIDLGNPDDADAVQWVVIGDQNQVVEQSRNASPELVAHAKAFASGTAAIDDETLGMSEGWKVLQRQLIAPAPQRINRELDEFDQIVIVVAKPTGPLHFELYRLLLLVCLLPLGVWLAAAALGRCFCRRALQPVLDMAADARAIQGADFQTRLPVGNTRDELADLACAFNALLDHRQKAYEQQRRFTGDAAHELRTPITVLLGQIEVALRRPRSPEEYAATLEVLRNQTQELKSITESLLFLARADGDAALPDLATISLASWLADYPDRWRQLPRQADLQLHIDTSDRCQVTASPTLLARLLDNLVENAFKYSEPGSPVELILSQHGSQAAIAVVDHGRGIAAEDMQAIFKPFFRAQHVRGSGIAGAGLGLAIAARIAEALGGYIQCDSELGRGSRFELWLPLADAEEAATPLPQPVALGDSSRR